MSAPHPGKWRPVFKKPPPGVQPNIVLNTELIAAHACVIHTPGSSLPWKVLYPNTYGVGPTGKLTTRIWDPNNPDDPISSQDIPNWPGVLTRPVFFAAVMHLCQMVSF